METPSAYRPSYAVALTRSPRDPARTNQNGDLVHEEIAMIVLAGGATTAVQEGV